jgi:hypothetical protein
MTALGRPVIVSVLRSSGAADLAQMVLTGVSAADSVVSLFDGHTLLGSTTADASGIWRFTIGAVWDEIQSFTAVATNAAGEMSAASPAVRVTAVMNRIASIVPDAAAVGDSIANAGVLMLNGAADDNLLHRVTATDAPGNTGAPPSALTLDAQTQAAPAIAPLSFASCRPATLSINDTADPVINATELSTVSGLNAGASGKVTVTDAANQSNGGHSLVNSVEQALIRMPSPRSHSTEAAGAPATPRHPPSLRQRLTVADGDPSSRR